MPRPISWLPRLAQIRRSVATSVRSHYERKDIERLFQLQHRAAQQLMLVISPAAKVGRSFLIATSDLAMFLDRVSEATDPSVVLRKRPIPAPRRSLRELIQVDQITATLETLPANLTLEPKRLTIEFESMEQLAGALLAIAQVLYTQEQFNLFEQRFVPPPVLSPKGLDERNAIARMWDALEDAERSFAEKLAAAG